MWATFVKQKRKNESGPVALINLGKWLEIKFGYRQYIKLFRKLCVCDAKADGTNSANFDIAIRSIFGWMGDVNAFSNPTPDDFYKAVKEEHGVVLKFNSTLGANHYIIVGKSYGQGDIYMVNYSKRETTSKIDKCAIHAILQNGATMWTVKSNL